MNIFDKETPIITGSNRGIGQSILLKFAEFGCKRIIACARKHTLDNLLILKMLF